MPTKGTFTTLTDAELREHLLANITIPDAMWAARLNKPDRIKGESRTDYIERVLAVK